MKRGIIFGSLLLVLPLFAFWAGMEYQAYRGFKAILPLEKQFRIWTNDSQKVQISKNAIIGKEVPTFSTENKSEIEEFISLFEFDQSKIPKVKVNFFSKERYSAEFSHCMCEGDFFIDWHKSDQSVFRFSLHHFKHIRTLNGVWGGDAVLGEESSQEIKRWFKDKEIIENKMSNQSAQATSTLPPVG